MGAKTVLTRATPRTSRARPQAARSAHRPCSLALLDPDNRERGHNGRPDVRTASRSWAAMKIRPGAVQHPDMAAPDRAAGPPASATIGWAPSARCSTSSPPGSDVQAQGDLVAHRPLGRNTAASCPSSSATRRSSSAWSSGPARVARSPTSAAAIAARIPAARAGLGVTVEVDCHLPQATQPRVPARRA